MSDKKKSTRPDDSKLSAATIKKITDLAAAAGIEAYRAEKEKERAAFADKRFGNTKLLLRKYRWLESYTSNAVYESSQLLDDDTEAVLEAFGADMNEVLKVQSIRKSVAITRTIMGHVKVMLDCYKRTCDASEKPEIRRRWRVIYQIFLADEPATAQDIAAVESISVSMVYNIVDSACEDLSTLFFGLDLTSI